MLGTLQSGIAVETPVFTRAAVDSATALDVKITCATPSADIRYTLNGELPQITDPVIRSGAVLRISNSATLKARAWDGAAVSGLAEEDYRITGAVAFGKQHGLALSRVG